MIRVAIFTAAAISAGAMFASVAEARDWSKPQQNRKERSDHIAPQVNGYGSYDRGQFRPPVDSFRGENKPSGGFSFGESSGFVFKGRER